MEHATVIETDNAITGTVSVTPGLFSEIRLWPKDVIKINPHMRTIEVQYDRLDEFVGYHAVSTAVMDLVAEVERHGINGLVTIMQDGLL